MSTPASNEFNNGACMNNIEKLQDENLILKTKLAERDKELAFLKMQEPSKLRETISKLEAQIDLLKEKSRG